MSKKPVALIIMDGFGYNASDYGNAITAANTPNLDKYMQGPHTLIGASGLDVGLPDGQMGNSEVGHTNIGAGRIVYQMLVKISKSIQDGDFFENPALKSAIENCKAKNSSLHLMGLLSPGGVHSHIEHLYGLLEMAKKNGAKLALITPSSEGFLLSIADMVVNVPAAAYKAVGDFVPSEQLMGNLFEQTLFIFYDILVMMLREEMDIKPEEMVARHRNVE